MILRTLQGDTLPNIFSEIPQPPKRLFILGELPSSDAVILTIVGSRKHTTYGRDVCEKLIAGLKGYPVVIVSGLALGIDTIAHETALAYGVKTIAFPGSGLDPTVLYPRINMSLAKRILEAGGALISEFDPTQRAAEWTFPRRNRLMAGYSKAVLIIEAEKESGTLITSRLAIEYNRDVLAVPGSIFSPASYGTNWLIRQGATPITSSEDLLRALGFHIDEGSGEAREYKDVTQEERELLDALYEPKTRDQLLRELGKSATELNMQLTIMELKGMIKEEVGEIRRV